MSHITDKDFVSQFYKYARLCILVTSIISIGVIVGWLIHIRALHSLFPNYIPMKPNAAFGFLFGSIMLYLKDRETESVYANLIAIVTTITALAIVTLGSLTLFEYFSGINLFIDQLIIRKEPSASIIFSPDRSSPITAFGLMLIGFAIILLNQKSIMILRQTLAILIGLCGIVVISSFGYNNSTNSPIVTYTSASVLSAVCLICMSMALLFIRPNEGVMKLITSRSEGGVFARILIPLVIILPILLGQLHAFGDNAKLYDTITGQALYTIIIIFLMLIISILLSSWLMKLAETRNQFENALQMSEERFHRALDMAPIGMAIIDLNGKYLEVNHALCRLTGYSKEELLTRTYQDITHPDDLKFDLINAQQLIKGNTHLYQVEKRYIRKDESFTWVQITAAVLHDKQTNEPIHFIVQIEDITLRKQAEAAIRNLAYHDTLTNLPNRRLLMDRISQSISIAKRRHYTLAIMFLDLDKFKDVNDTMGHDVGDELLKAVSTRLVNLLREEDTIARISGDEFVIVLHEITSPNDASLVAEKINHELIQPFLIDDNEITIGVSIGIAIYPNDGDDALVLLKNADTAMYAAKNLGRNKYRFYGDHNNTI